MTGGKEIVPSHHLNHKIPFNLLIQVEKYAQDNGIPSRTAAINKLIEVGIIVERNKNKIQDPEFITELYDQLKEGGAVDYMQRLTDKEFAVITSIVEIEKRARGGENSKITNF